MTAIAYPSLTNGLDGIRLRAAIDRAGTFFTKARLQCDRRQQPVHVTVDPKGNRLLAVAVDGGWSDVLVFDKQLRVVAPKESRAYVLYPSAPAPRFRLLLGNGGGGRAGLQINVFTGVPEEWNGEGAR